MKKDNEIIKKRVLFSDNVLDKIEHALLILIFTSFLFHIVISAYFYTLSTLLSLIVGLVVIISLILTKIIENVKEKRKREKQNLTINDYKQNENYLSVILNLLTCIYLAVVITSYIIDYNLEIDKFDILNINISLCSLIITIYIFLAPLFKSEIKKLETIIDLKVEEAKNVQGSDLSGQLVKFIKFLQSEGYYLQKKYNNIKENIILNSYLFIFSIILTFISGSNFVLYFLVSATIYSAYNILCLMFEFRQILNFNLKKYEEEANDKIDSIEK